MEYTCWHFIVFCDFLPWGVGVKTLKVMYLDRLSAGGSVLYSKVFVFSLLFPEKEITNSKENSQNLPRLSSTVKQKILCSVTSVEIPFLRA
jgi:hypothetical protein